MRKPCLSRHPRSMLTHRMRRSPNTVLLCLASRSTRPSDWELATSNGDSATNGTWEDPEIETPSGGSSLAALALLEAGEKSNSPAVVKSLEFLRKYEPGELRSTYAIALQTMVYAAAEPKKDRSRIAANVAWLERAQIKKGDKVRWPGSWTYSDRKLTRPGDASCSYFALLALHAASEAGVPVNSEVWSAARTFWKNGQKRDGAWAYTPDSDVIAASVTCTGISSSLMANQWIGLPGGRELIKNDVVRGCGIVGIDSSPRKGLEWLADHFSVKTNIGHGPQWQYYYLWGLEQAGRLAGVRRLGQQDWYQLGADELVRSQDKLSGHWQGVFAEGHRLVATCFAVIFLANGRLPVLINKLRHAPGNDWDNDSHDVSHLVSIVSRDWETRLCWQMLDLDQANAPDFSPAPIVFFNGHKRPEFSAAARQKLREYVEHGGFVFAEACCGSAEFDEGFRKLVKEMFPEREHELRPLADNHPIWTAKYNMVPGSHPISGVQQGARTSIIYTSNDLSCYWNQARSAPSNPAVVKAIQLGQNVVDYATGRELPPDKLSVR